MTELDFQFLDAVISCDMELAIKLALEYEQGAEMFRNGCLEGIEALMAEGEIYDIDYTGWIPVSERLPSNDGKYLVFYEGTIIGSNIEIMWYGEPLMPNVDVKGKHFYRSDAEWGDIIYDEVVAWMPLPKPYREDGE